MANGERRHRLVHARYFVLMLSVLALLTLIIGFAFLYRSLRTLVGDSESLLHSQADIIAAETVQLLSADSRMTEILASSDSFRRFADYGDEVGEQITRDAYTLSREMATMAAAYGIGINNLAAWFVNSGYVVTMSRWLDRAHSDLFFDAYPGLSEEQFLSVAETQNWVALSGGAEQHCWSAFRVRFRGKTTAVIFVDVNLKDFLQNRMPQGSRIYIASEDRLLLSYPGEYDAPALSALREGLRSGLVRLDGEDYLLESEETRLGSSVLVALNRRELNGIERGFQLAVAVTGLIILLCIYILVRYMRTRLIQPVEELIRTVGHEGGDPRLALSSVADSYVAERDANQQMRREKSHLLPLALGRQLTHLVSISDSEAAVQCAKSCLLLAGIGEESFLMFALSCVDDRKGFFREINEDPRFRQQGDVFLYLINNVLTDMLFEKTPGAVAAVRKNWVLVLVKKPSPYDPEEIQTVIRELIDFYDKSFDAKLVSTNVSAGEGAESFIPALMTVSKEISYLDFWGADRMIPAAEAEEPEADFSDYSQRIRKLINRISTEDYDAVPALIDEIMEEAIPSGVQNIHISRYRLYTMTALIVTALDEQLRDNRDLAAMLNFEERLYKADNVAAFRDELRSVISELVEYRKNQEELSGGARRVEAAKLYIQKHYTDNDLTVSLVAERLGISSSYLSREFKENTGINILEYLQRMRVEAAKPLLLSESVKSVAEKVGFGDAQGLMRAFKKYEGIAPGEYRKIAAKEVKKDGTAS